MRIKLNKAIKNLVGDSHRVEIGDPSRIYTGRVVSQGAAVGLPFGWFMAHLRWLLARLFSVILLVAAGDRTHERDEHQWHEQRCHAEAWKPLSPTIFGGNTPSGGLWL